MRLFRVDDPDSSRDEDENVAARGVMQASLENSDSSDSDSDDASKNSDLSDSDSDDASDLPVSGNPDEGQPSSNQMDNLSSRAGVTSKLISDTTKRDTAAAENVFSERPRATSYSQRGVQSEVHIVCLLLSPCFVLFINSPSNMDRLITKTFQWNFAR